MFFTNFGAAYTTKITDVPASTGYGEPIQSLFKFKDGEKVVGALSLDPRAIGVITSKNPETPPPVHALAVTSDGYSLRFSLEPLRRAEHARRPAVRARRRGRRGRRRRARSPATRSIIAATRQARAMLCKVDEVNFLGGPGRGVILIKLQKEDDRLLGFIASTGDRDLMTVETTRGAEQTISTAKYEVTGRGGKGRELLAARPVHARRPAPGRGAGDGERP